mmetsp:Transcript_24090/g.48769  ORF Transcript_24090/g.48769 Transcript_24090/m.48769 type:complete len:240 (-) Transcript_24090:310-1029(-)
MHRPPFPQLLHPRDTKICYTKGHHSPTVRNGRHAKGYAAACCRQSTQRIERGGRLGVPRNGNTKGRRPGIALAKVGGRVVDVEGDGGGREIGLRRCGPFHGARSTPHAVLVVHHSGDRGQGVFSSKSHHQILDTVPALPPLPRDGIGDFSAGDASLFNIFRVLCRGISRPVFKFSGVHLASVFVNTPSVGFHGGSRLITSLLRCGVCRTSARVVGLRSCAVRRSIPYLPHQIQPSLRVT